MNRVIIASLCLIALLLAAGCAKVKEAVEAMEPSLKGDESGKTSFCYPVLEVR